MNLADAWVDRYRPSTLNDLCLDPKIKERITSWGKDIPHLLLVGNAGIGKCLDGDEEIEILTDSEEEYEKLISFLGKGKTV